MKRAFFSKRNQHENNSCKVFDRSENLFFEAKRTIIFISGLFFFIYSSMAAIITVSNNASSPAQYSNLQTAITNAKSGDTIYVQGSPTSYGNITVNKIITLIGAGYAPDSTDYNISTQIGLLAFDSVSNVLISGTKFISLSFYDVYNAITYASGDRGVINNVTFEKCYFHNNYNYPYYLSGRNWTFLNCIFDFGHIDFNYYSSIIFSNCFFINVYFLNSNKNSVSVYNSIFLNYNSTMFNNVSYISVYNSIFWNNTVSGCSNCLFMNNITYDDILKDLPGDGNSGTGNINNLDPQFASTFPSPTINITYDNLKSYNWNLKTSSPGHNAGTDSTDIGFYGGAYPFKNLSGMYQQIPVIKSFIIKNPVVQKNGSLKISVTAIKK